MTKLVVPRRLAECLAYAKRAAPLVAAGGAMALSSVATGQVRFTDATAAAGLDFVHQSGRRGELWTVEITGAGVGLLDFDGDGWLDVWLSQGGPLAGRERLTAAALPGDRLYRNVGRTGEPRFQDITVESGVRATGYGMGIATGDIDNDGDLDVFLANFGANQLFENRGGGRFEDITAAAGITGDAWSIAASFADVDGDGWLDLYVGNYLNFSFADYRPCRRWSSRPTYCAPSNFQPVADRLYRNLGERRFLDVSERSGIATRLGGAMGVVADDFNGDGATDFYVANDGVDNLLWLNRGDFRFVEGGLLAGVAVNADGVAEASMGIAVADYDRDGDADLFVTHDVKETNTLYVNDGKGWFEDRSVAAGVAADSLPFTAFGTGWVDVDLDGDLDLVNVNGAVAVIEQQIAAGIEPPLRQFNQLMLNDGQGNYAAADGGPAFANDGISRGAAFGDLDNDGDVDVVVANNDGPARLYRNDTPTTNWLGIDLRGGAVPSAAGALVWRDIAGAERKRRRTDGSYASAHDQRLLFGLGRVATPQAVRVRWPDGREERFAALAVNRYHTLHRGTGDAAATLATAGESAAAVAFEEVALRAGVDFKHVNGMVGERWLAEIIGAGVAVFDFDQDGRLDIWLVQGGPLAGRDTKALPSDRLYRNVGNSRELRFHDVTDTAGVEAMGYGMGIATGDIDGDGDLDVFLANFGANQLFENLGDGRFRDITSTSGLAGNDWSAGASFADIDGDGRLDLYVANYVDFSLATHKVCRDLASRPTYCSPQSYASTPDRLYRNLGAGRFADVSAAAGIGGPLGAALGVIAADFDADGRVDFYVANDATDNLLWINQGDGRFVDHALLAGVAVNGDGDAEASMGVVAEDFDADCDVDLFVTHLTAETNTLYANDGSGAFVDVSNRRGIAAASTPFTGFGTAWFDADNDGDLDLFAANGTITEVAAQQTAGIEHPFAQRNQLWLNDGAGDYREWREGAVRPFDASPAASRGAAFGDLDNDGDMDIVVANNNGSARLYRNIHSDTAPAHWLGVELRSVGRPIGGSVVGLESRPCRQRRAATDGSYASASDPRLVFGLGDANQAQFVRVRWTDGKSERFGPLAADRYHRLHAGEGAP